MNKLSKNIDNLNPKFLEEWKASRTVISFLDDKLYDLRKYGFSFITALISAEGLIVTYLDPAKNWPDDIKFAVLFVNILMILGLTILDRNFSVIQRATGTRARVLERILNLELSERIGQRYLKANLEHFATGLYGVFVVAVMFLASFIINRSEIYYWLLIVTGIGAIIALIVIRHYTGEKHPYGKMDWTIDRLRCTQGDQIAITLTNLDKKEMLFPASKNEPRVMWEVKEEGETAVASGECGTIKKAINIDPDDSYTWLWSTNNCSGVYRVYRLIRRKDEEELVCMKRKIIVKEKRAV